MLRSFLRRFHLSLRVVYGETVTGSVTGGKLRSKCVDVPSVIEIGKQATGLSFRSDQVFFFFYLLDGFLFHSLFFKQVGFLVFLDIGNLISQTFLARVCF